MAKQSQQAAPNTGSEIGPEEFLRVLENATAYPVMVTDASAPGATRTGPADESQRIIDSALRAVLGGRTRVDDPNGLKAALSRSFVEDRVHGRRVYRNVPRGSIADTVGEGEVSGFQGALMAHAGEAIDHGLPLLDGVKSLLTTVDEEDVAARAAVVRSNMMGLRDEFGRRDGPRPAVVENLLAILLGEGSSTDPDRVKGAVGRLRDDLGLATGLFANNVEDERHTTNYRLLAEYVVGLRTAWQTARPIFGTGTFVGAQMRHVELTMQTITESLDQVRTAMDSVFVGEAERKIRRVTLTSLGNARMTIEELLDWAEETVSPDSLSLIREGGRIAIADSLVPTAQTVLKALNDVTSSGTLPGGLGAPRVMASLRDLQAQWEDLTVELLEPLGVQSTAVPDVRGRRLNKARKALRKKGLNSQTNGQAADSGIVLSSNPAPGQQVQPGRTIVLTVEDCPPGSPAHQVKAPPVHPKGRSDQHEQQPAEREPLAGDSVAMPDVHGMQLGEAREALLEAGLRPEALEQSTDAAVVWWTSPDPGQQVPRGDQVWLSARERPADDETSDAEFHDAQPSAEDPSESDVDESESTQGEAAENESAQGDADQAEDVATVEESEPKAARTRAPRNKTGTKTTQRKNGGAS